MVGAEIGTAQAPTPFASWGNGYGMMGHFAQSSDYAWMNHQWMLSNGGMHNIVWQGLADTLKMKLEDLTAKLAKGKTLTRIAEAKGLSLNQLATTLKASMNAGLDKAVKD